MRTVSPDDRGKLPVSTNALKAHKSIVKSTIKLFIYFFFFRPVATSNLLGLSPFITRES